MHYIATDMCLNMGIILKYINLRSIESYFPSLCVLKDLPVIYAEACFGIFPLFSGNV